MRFINSPPEYTKDLRSYFICFLIGSVLATGLFSGLHSDLIVGSASADEIVSLISKATPSSDSENMQDQHQTAHCTAASCAWYLALDIVPHVELAHEEYFVGKRYSALFFGIPPDKPPNI